jgi:protein SCO1/2
MRWSVLALLLACAGCSADRTADLRRFQLTGMVVDREAAGHVVVSHNAVNGLMPAMTMPFAIAGDPPALNEKDRIVATLVVTADRSWLEDVRVTARDGVPETRTDIAGRGVPGAIVPDLPLVDQDGRARTLRDPAGRILVVTFIYTRCPLPDFCPLMVRHLESVRRRASEEGLGNHVAFLGITLDPAFDSPPVLHQYGKSVLKGSSPFEQWTFATGTSRQIADAAAFFAVGYRAEGGVVTHTLTTAAIGADGRVIQVFRSNSWRPDDVYDVIRGAVERAAME